MRQAEPPGGPPLGGPPCGDSSPTARRRTARRPEVGTGQEGPAEIGPGELDVDEAHSVSGGPFQRPGIARGLDGGELAPRPTVSNQVDRHDRARCKSCVTSVISPARGGSRRCLNRWLPGRPGRDILVRVGPQSGRGASAATRWAEIGSIRGTGVRPSWVDDAPSLWESVGPRRGEDRSPLAGLTDQAHARQRACARKSRRARSNRPRRRELRAGERGIGPRGRLGIRQGVVRRRSEMADCRGHEGSPQGQ